MQARRHDLIERTFQFALLTRQFVNRVPRLLANIEDCRQLVRSSGSVAANYLEAQEALSRRDFFYRIKVCRKEAREAGLWLRLVNVGDSVTGEAERGALVAEARELKLIFAAIANRDDSGATTSPR